VARGLPGLNPLLITSQLKLEAKTVLVHLYILIKSRILLPWDRTHQWESSRKSMAHPSKLNSKSCKCYALKVALHKELMETTVNVVSLLHKFNSKSAAYHQLVEAVGDLTAVSACHVGALPRDSQCESLKGIHSIKSRGWKTSTTPSMNCLDSPSQHAGRLHERIFICLKMVRPQYSSVLLD
jgi:hypothetical protein